MKVGKQGAAPYPVVTLLALFLISLAHLVRGGVSISCPGNVKSFSGGPGNGGVYYECGKKGDVPVLRNCPGNQIYWPSAQECIHGHDPNTVKRQKGNTIQKSGAIPTTLPVLGAVVYLGDLYDATRGEVIPGMSLWNPDTLKTGKRKSILPTSSLDIVSDTDKNDYMDKWDIKGSVKLNVLSGMMSGKGSLSFLKEVKTNDKVVNVVLKYSATTRSETIPSRIPIDNQELCTHIQDKKTGQRPTHVVSSLVYGMNADFVFKQDTHDAKSKYKIGANLKMAVKHIPVNVSFGVGVDIGWGNNVSVTNMSVKVIGDFILDKQPNTYEDAIVIYKKIRSYMGEGPEYTKAAKVKMTVTPLNMYCPDTEVKMKDISFQLTEETSRTIIEMDETMDRLRRLSNSPVVNKYLPLQIKVQEYLAQFEAYDLSIRDRIQEALPRIRADKVAEKDLVYILNNYTASRFEFSQARLELNQIEMEINIINYIIRPGSFVNVVVSDFREANDIGMLYDKKSIVEMKVNILKKVNLIRISKETAPDPKKVDKPTSDEKEDELNEDEKDEKEDELKEEEKEDELKEKECNIINDAQGGKWYNNKKKLSNLGMDLAAFKDFAGANKHNVNLGFVFMIGDEIDSGELATFSAYADPKKGKTSFKCPGKPSRVVVHSYTHDSVSFKLHNPDNPDITTIVVSYFGVKDGAMSKIQTSFDKSSFSKNGIEITVEQLEPNWAYMFTMHFTTAIGNSPEWSNPEEVTTRAASRVRDLRDEPESPDKPNYPYTRKIMWTKPQFLAAELFHKYKITVLGKSIGDKYLDIIETTEPPVIIRNLKAGNKYTVTVEAELKSKYGDEYDLFPGGVITYGVSGSIELTAKPEPPHRLILKDKSVKDTSASIIWKEPKDYDRTKQIELYNCVLTEKKDNGKAPITMVAKNQEECSFKGLSKNTKYVAKVNMELSDGTKSEYSEEFKFRTKGASLAERLENQLSQSAETEVTKKFEKGVGKKLKENVEDFTEKAAKCDEKAKKIMKNEESNQNNWKNVVGLGSHMGPKFQERLVRLKTNVPGMEDIFLRNINSFQEESKKEFAEKSEHITTTLKQIQTKLRGTPHWFFLALGQGLTPIDDFQGIQTLHECFNTCYNRHIQSRANNIWEGKTTRDLTHIQLPRLLGDIGDCYCGNNYVGSEAGVRGHNYRKGGNDVTTGDIDWRMRRRHFVLDSNIVPSIMSLKIKT